MKTSCSLVMFALFYIGLTAVAQETAGNPSAAASSGIAGPQITYKTVKTASPYGTANYLPVWTSSNTIQNSVLYQSGSQIGIGTTSPTAGLDVNGAINAATSFNLAGNLFAFGSYANHNAFLGFAGNTTMSGTLNTGIGWQALFSNTTGYGNTAGGYVTLQSNTTGAGNTAFGYSALQFNTSGYVNTATGWQALQMNTTGFSNSAYGNSALNLNTTGNYNTATGDTSLQSNTTGGGNTANGFQALVSNSTGSNNTASGFQALHNNTGDGNTASGYQALYSNTTGTLNTAVGVYALNSNTTGSYNTGLGYGANASSGALTNATAIGAFATVGESNALVLGGYGNHAVNVGIGTATPANVFTIAQGSGVAISDGWTTYSSRRWKTNIQPLHGALDKIERLRGVSYDLKESGKHEIGVIAEEVGAVVPEIVRWEKNGTDAQGVDYGRLTALLIEATKEQQALIHQQQQQIQTQQAQIQAQQAESKLQAARIDHLTRQIQTVRTAMRTSALGKSAVLAKARTLGSE